MPVKSYPFIDIAVHERVREHFARGDAAILFATDLSRVLWSNGEGASLFGLASIYDFLDGGPSLASVAFRQMQSTARQLRETGETRRFLMRISSGFQSVTVNAELALIDVRAGERAILFTAPRLGRAISPAEAAARMISGFDDPDTHMAVLDGQGGVLASSPQFAALGMTGQTLLSLVEAVGRDSDWLLKRPVPTGKGTLPAAIGKVSADPDLHLLFAVETILGHMDATSDFGGASAGMAVAPIEAVTAPGEEDGTGDPDASEAAEIDAADEAGPGTHAPETSEREADELEVETGPDALKEGDGRDGGDAPFAEASLEADLDETGHGEVEPNLPLADIEEDTPIPTVEVPDGADARRGVDEPDEAEPSSDDRDAMAETVATSETDENASTVTAGTSLNDDLPPAFPEEAEEATAEHPSAPENETATDDAAGIDDDALAAPPPFQFDPAMRAIRFVWKIGADGRFSEISGEFALAVGPQAADVLGQSFSDLAARFALDPDGTIVDLLNRRDTWSGKTVLWPVEGEALRVPVDLAALPTYSRNREFDGFRGFGIVRISDAVADPTGRGLNLSEPVAPATDDDEPASDSDVFASESDAPDTAPVADDATVDTETAGRQTFEDDSAFFAAADEGRSPDPDEPEDDRADDGLPHDPFMGEKPALRLATTSTHDISTNIVQINEARPAATETLTRSEQAAFREIARQLTTTFGKRTEAPAKSEDDAAPAEGDPEQTASESEMAATSEGAVGEGATKPETTGSDTDGGTSDTGNAPAGDEVSATPVPEAAEHEPLHAEDPAAASAPTPAADETPETVSIAEEPIGPSGEDEPAEDVHTSAAVIAPLGDASPEDDKGERDIALSPAMVDSLDGAILIHSGDELYHANTAFLDLTGYQTLQDLRVEGGIDALFVGEDEGILDVPPGAMMMIRNDGRLVPVTARLQAVRFDDKGVALMMSLALVEATAQDLSVAEDSATAPIPQTEEDAPPQRAAAEPTDTSLADKAAIAEAEARVEALRIETEELRSILETATDGVVVMGTDGDIRSLNRSANALFNYNDVDVIGKPFATLFAHESQRAVMDYLAGLSGHGVASVLNDGREVIGREASGGFIPLFMTMGRLSSSSGYCAVIRDITQWKRTEEELRSAKRAAETANAHKTDFLARVSHEIRTPLNAIIGFSDMMASEHFGPIGSARYIEYASDIGRSGRHVLDIVNDLLDISKIEAGEMELDFAAVEINEAVSEAVSLVQPQANAQRVIIRTSLSTSVPSVVADNRSIKQIALNILANAIRFTPAGGQIVVSTAYETNGSVMLRIRDTGVGMTRTELEQAMKPFRQVTTGARKRGEGTGLGLPLTKAMAEANRALFAINSAPNEGTLVEITFPSQRVLAN